MCIIPGRDDEVWYEERIRHEIFAGNKAVPPLVQIPGLSRTAARPGESVH